MIGRLFLSLLGGFCPLDSHDEKGLSFGGSLVGFIVPSFKALDPFWGGVGLGPLTLPYDV